MEEYMQKEKVTEYNYVICLDNTDYSASLEVGKIYRAIPDKNAEKHGYLRIVDESGEDYAYSSNRFSSIKLPQVVQEALFSTFTE